MTSCCWLAESAACSPARRPRRRCDSASQPPWRYCFIQRFTALGWTPNTRAASAWVIPSSTAWTARLRSAAWAAPGRDRASSFDMPRAYDIPLYLPAGVITPRVGRHRGRSDLADPGAQRLMAEPEFPRDLADRLAGRSDQRDRIVLELRAVLGWASHPSPLPLDLVQSRGVQASGGTPEDLIERIGR